MQIDEFRRDVVAPVSPPHPKHACPAHGMHPWDMQDSLAYEGRELELNYVNNMLTAWVVWRTGWEVMVLVVALVDAALVAKFAPKHTKAHGISAFKAKAREELRASWHRLTTYSYSSRVLTFAQLAHAWFKTDITIFLYYLYFDVARTLWRVARSLWQSFGNFFRRRGFIQDALSGSKTAPTCFVCYERPTDCFLNPCGHTFCTHCVRQWFQEHNTCPMCRRQAKCGLKMFHPCA